MMSLSGSDIRTDFSASNSCIVVASSESDAPVSTSFAVKGNIRVTYGISPYH